MSYDPKFVTAAAQQARGEGMQKMAKVNYADRRTEPVDAVPERIVSGINIEFVANGFLVSPQCDWLGRIHRTANVARDKDELLRLIGEMIDAHAS